jgi:hypothetical protein
LLFREQVCKQFHPVLRAETVSSLTTNGSTPTILPPFQHLGAQSPNLSNQYASSIQNQNKVNSNNPGPTPTKNPNPDHSTENRLTRCATAPAASQVTPDPMVLPPWASNTANAVMARLNPTEAFDIEGRYWVKPDFLKVLREVEGVSQTQVVFPYREVIISESYFTRFI